MNAWILASRPKTLSAAIVPVLAGTSMAYAELRHVAWWLFLCALGGSIFIQIGTNFVNDALDFKKGADTAERLGPLRVTSAGLLTHSAVMRGAWICFIIAALLGIPLIMHAGWPLLVIGLMSILAAYAYTGGPYPLAYNGLGELFVILFFGLIAVGGSYYVQTLSMNVTVLLAGLAIGSLATVLLAINNLRDAANDRVSSKRTMAVRFGERFARMEIVAFALIPFVIAVVLAVLRKSWWLLLVLLALPLTIALLRRVRASSGAALNRCLAMSGALQWLFGILFSIGALLR
jgi:1,4-dihydroxy-2-naphthoate octaprenyltransferase